MPIHHGIDLGRDAINAAGKTRSGCGILDMDLIAASDWLVMACVFMVLKRKGVMDTTINRIRNLDKNNINICKVNNTMDRAFINTRMSLRQEDVPSMHWFAFGIDPFLSYLVKRLKGIQIYSLLLSGPALENCLPLPPLVQSYKARGYADDIKTGITLMEEFLIVDI
jgi:hypothetical protein